MSHKYMYTYIELILCFTQLTYAFNVMELNVFRHVTSLTSLTLNRRVRKTYATVYNYIT